MKATTNSGIQCDSMNVTHGWRINGAMLS